MSGDDPSKAVRALDGALPLPTPAAPVLDAVTRSMDLAAAAPTDAMQAAMSQAASAWASAPTAPMPNPPAEVLAQIVAGVRALEAELTLDVDALIAESTLDQELEEPALLAPDCCPQDGP